MADRESIRHPELAKAISAFFDTDVEDGPGVLQKRDVSLVYDVGRIEAARDGYDPPPQPVALESTTNEPAEYPVFVSNTDTPAVSTEASVELASTSEPARRAWRLGIATVRVIADAAGDTTTVTLLANAGLGVDVVLTREEITLDTSPVYPQKILETLREYRGVIFPGRGNLGGKGLLVKVAPVSGVSLSLAALYQRTIYPTPDAPNE